MPVETINWKNGAIRYVDQTQLPVRLVYRSCSDLTRFWRAIKRLEVRGAPALGIAGALGVLLGTERSTARDYKGLSRDMESAIRYLGSSRPTAVNLFWAFDRMRRAASKERARPVGRIKAILRAEALRIIDEDKRNCRAMARHGARLIRSGSGILTHCNAGGLATADYGTALGVLFEAHRQGKRMKVYADETRPLLQGARLTAWELLHEGIDTTLICDNMAASLMARGAIDAVFVGADRIASNGDTANKIGTYSLAVLAHHHAIPFYVVAPVSTIDFAIRSGRSIPIEERDGDEVRCVAGRIVAPPRVKAYNPAFDVTPHGLITAIITERGISRAPYRKNLGRLG